MGSTIEYGIIVLGQKLKARSRLSKLSIKFTLWELCTAIS